MSDIKISQDVLDKLLIPSTATLTAQLSRLGLWNTFMHDVRPLKLDMKMAGPAFTMRYIPAGEILVIDAREDTHAGTMGNILATRIHCRGAAGIVTDGAYRDSPAIVGIGIPTYARAMNANTNKTIHHPIDIQLPVACGGVSVYPGDIIVGDDEGVVVVPREYAVEVAEKGVEQEQKEAFILHKIEGGASIIGTYPADEKTTAEFEEWKKSS
jgi:regulator of RNase E activity RraA